MVLKLKVGSWGSRKFFFFDGKYFRMLNAVENNPVEKGKKIFGRGGGQL